MNTPPTVDVDGHVTDSDDTQTPIVNFTPTDADDAPADADLPLCMQPGWDPMTPGREAQAAFLDACIAEGIDDRDADPDGYWATQW